MTQEYKQNILEFLTGNLPENSSTVQPIFKNQKIITNNLMTDIKANYSSTITIVDFITAKNPNNQDSNMFVIAVNGTLTGESNPSGAFVIVNENYEYVDIITHYKDGTIINQIECVNITENGEFYYIDKISSTSYGIKLINNIAIKPVGSNVYQANLIENYSIPMYGSYTWKEFYKVFRNEVGNKFCLVGSRIGQTETVICDYTIETNSWQYSIYTNGTKAWEYAKFDNGYRVFWDSENNLNFQIAFCNNGLRIISKLGTSPMTQKLYLTYISTNAHNNFIFYSNEIGYCSYITTAGSTDTFNLYKIDMTNEVYTSVYTDEAPNSSYNSLWLFKNDNQIFYKHLARYSLTIYFLNFGFINDVVNYLNSFGAINVTANVETTSLYSNVVTMYNKISAYIQNQDKNYSIEFNWDKDGYNGQPFISSGSLQPGAISITDNNNVEIFNRNLTQLTNYSNFYIATTQIPYFDLNESQIHKATLLSKNINELVPATLDLTKNIYEELNINFTNTFRVIANGIEDLICASDFTSAMLQRQVSAKATKCKVYYLKDENYDIINIDTSSLVYTNLKTTYTIQVTVPEDKVLSHLDLVSEDTTITYFVYNCREYNLEEGTYTFTFDVRID